MSIRERISEEISRRQIATGDLVEPSGVSRAMLFRYLNKDESKRSDLTGEKLDGLLAALNLEVSPSDRVELEAALTRLRGEKETLVSSVEALRKERETLTSFLRDYGNDQVKKGLPVYGTTTVADAVAEFMRRERQRCLLQARQEVLDELNALRSFKESVGKLLEVAATKDGEPAAPARSAPTEQPSDELSLILEDLIGVPVTNDQGAVSRQDVIASRFESQADVAVSEKARSEAEDLPPNWAAWLRRVP